MPLSVAIADPMTRDFERVGERGREETPGSSPTLLSITTSFVFGSASSARMAGLNDEVVCGDMCG